jgi:L-alanine-DL-glutamate epimerase-like enolase superfamily enzyme
MRILQLETFRPPQQPNILFVTLTTDDGLVGLGEAFFGAKAVETYLHETAAPLLLKMPDANPELAASVLRPYVGYQGAGAEVRGNAAIDLALWDLLGQQAGLPLVKLFGGAMRDSIGVYNTCAGSNYVRSHSGQSSDNWGLPVGEADIERYDDLHAFLTRPAELARDLLDEGVTGMKIWPFDLAGEASGGTDISGADLAAGLKIVESIRGEVGMAMDLMIELHGQWNRPAAEKIIRALEPYAPYWVEDPMRPDAFDAFTHLARDSAIPIAVGETAVGRRGVLPLLSSGAVDILTLDLQWSGGLTEARKIASLADTFGIPVAPHDCTGPATLAACIHLSCSQPNGLIQETVRAFLRTWYTELVTGLPEVVDGRVGFLGTPGHGVKLQDTLWTDPRVHRVTSSNRETVAS